MIYEFSVLTASMILKIIEKEPASFPPSRTCPPLGSRLITRQISLKYYIASFLHAVGIICDLSAKRPQRLGADTFNSPRSHLCNAVASLLFTLRTSKTKDPPRTPARIRFVIDMATLG